MGIRLGQRSAIREAFERAGQLKRAYGSSQVFDLSIGNPTAPCPAGVAAALDEAKDVAASAHGYMDSSGYGDVREAVAASLRDRFGIGYEADDIIMTTGAACAINIAMQTLLDPDDEVVVFRPYYPAYRPFIMNWDARIVEVPYGEGFVPDLAAFCDALTPRTKIVLVNTPNNPSGVVYSASVAHAIARAMEDAQERFGHEVYLVSDEPYRELLYGGAVNPQWPALYDNALVVYSFSKSASIAGERIGYLALSPTLADKDLVRQGACRSLGDLGFVNAPATSQRMARRCVSDFADLSRYDRNRMALYRALVEFGFAPHKPEGAFYMLLPAPDGDEQRLLDRLLAENIIAVGGGEFGCPGYVRLSFCVPPETIDSSLPHFRRVAQAYGLADAAGPCTCAPVAPSAHEKEIIA